MFPVYDRPLAEHVCSETKSDFRRFLTLVVTVCFVLGSKTDKRNLTVILVSTLELYSDLSSPCSEYFAYC